MKYSLTLLLACLTIFTSAQSNLKALDPDLTNYEYPFPVNFVDINIQNQSLKMAVMDVKPSKANGKTVVLLHGKNFNGAYWKTTINALVSDGYRVIVPDQIGFGKSSKPRAFQYSFQQLAENTKHVLSKLGAEKVVVLGHSMGGMLATRFALMYPEAVEKLVLVNPIGLEDYKLVAPYKSIDWWFELERKKDYEAIKKYQLVNYYDKKWKPAYDEWVNLLAGWTLHKDYARIAWNAALTYDMIYTQPVVYEFGNLKCPTLILNGTRDRTALGKPLVSEKVRATMGRYDKLGEITRNRIKDATLVELDDVGHMPHIEAFDRFIVPLKSFLAK